MIDGVGVLDTLETRWMKRGGNEGHPRNHLRFGFRVVKWKELRVWIDSSEVVEDTRNLGEHEHIDDKCRNLALGIERQIGRTALLAFSEGKRVTLEGRADFVQRDMGSHGTRTGR